MQTEIYLDANATSPVLEAAITAACAAMRDSFGNPSSSHGAGIRAKVLLDSVRARACRLLGVGAGRLNFTSGATEGIQTAVLSALCAIRERQAGGEATGELLLYGATEHKAVPESLAHWNRVLGLGLELRALPVDTCGRHRLDVLRELAPKAAMVCTMAANNETGVISDIAGIGAVLRETGSAAYWMVDSVQALGKLQLDLSATRIDYAPYSGHKLYAPKGIGMLYVRDGAPYTALMCGGGQEAGQRAGTENMAGVAALGAVLEALEEGSSFRSNAELTGFRLRLAEALRCALPGIVFNAPFETTLPTTLNFSVPDFSSKELLDLFDAAGVRVSAGSACSSAKSAPSYVLEAMQLPHWQCAAAVRMSFGPMVDAAFIDAACERIEQCGAALRASGLIGSSFHAQSVDGLVQLAVDGACTWLVLDAASRSCVVIDPREPLAKRIAQMIGCQQYRVRAVIDTGVHPDGKRGRAALLSLLDSTLDRAASVDALGWPVECDTISLGTGEQVAAITLGARVLAQFGTAAGVTYLLGARGKGGVMAPSDVAFAFQSDEAEGSLAAVAGPHTILCHARDKGAMAPYDTTHQIAEPALAKFLNEHPDALLVDVREAYEHLAANAGSWHGCATHNVPLSRITNQLGSWLRGEPRPIVFYCRSGARSAKAAACLHRLGYANAWHVGGPAL